MLIDQSRYILGLEALLAGPLLAITEKLPPLALLDVPA